MGWGAVGGCRAGSGGVFGVGDRRVDSVWAGRSPAGDRLDCVALGVRPAVCAGHAGVIQIVKHGFAIAALRVSVIAARRARYWGSVYASAPPLRVSALKPGIACLT